MRPQGRSVWSLASAAVGLMAISSALSASGDDAPKAVGVAWPEAEALFHRDPGWLGGDGAWTVDLGADRVLWLFADSFATNKPLPGRRGAAFIHNSVAIQKGHDPTTAEFDATWRNVDEQPQSFFADDGERFYWPGDGEIVDGKLVVFLVRIERTDRGLGFRLVDWTAVVIDNPEAAPSEWRPRKLKVPAESWGAIVGFGSVLVEGEYLYAFSFGQSPWHPHYLVRWPKGAVAAGDLSEPQWQTPGSDVWIRQADMKKLAPPTKLGGQTEYTVHRDAKTQRYLHVQTAFFPVSPLAVRTAPALVGPWSEPVNFFDPPELKTPRDGFYLYSAKAHPTLEADGALAVTYCTNHRELGTLVDDLTLYYPRFVRVKVE